MKKNLFLVAAIALALIFLSACGSSKTNDEQPDSDGTTVSDDDTTEPADTGDTEPTDTGDTAEPTDTGDTAEPTDTGEPEPDGDTGEPETDGDTTEPETDGDTTEPETDGDTTEPETDGDTTEPENDSDAADHGQPGDDDSAPVTDDEPGTDEDSAEPETDSDSEISLPDEDIHSLGCMTNSDCNTGEICSHNICVAADPCSSVTCGNGGVCTDEAGVAKCNCTSGYYDNNTSCVEITGSSVVGWVGIQWPQTLTNDDADKKVYGQIYVEGQTGSEVPQHADWKAQLLYKAGSGSAEYPVIASAWNKIDAEFNSGHSGDNNHEYMAEFPTNAAGSYIYIFRFSLDNGVSWWYADATPAIITSATNTPGQATIN